MIYFCFDIKLKVTKIKFVCVCFFSAGEKKTKNSESKGKTIILYSHLCIQENNYD